MKAYSVKVCIENGEVKCASAMCKSDCPNKDKCVDGIVAIASSSSNQPPQTTEPEG